MVSFGTWNLRDSYKSFNQADGHLAMLELMCLWTYFQNRNPQLPLRSGKRIPIECPLYKRPFTGDSVFPSSSVFRLPCCHVARSFRWKMGPNWQTYARRSKSSVSSGTDGISNYYSLVRAGKLTFVILHPSEHHIWSLYLAIAPIPLLASIQWGCFPLGQVDLDFGLDTPDTRWVRIRSLDARLNPSQHIMRKFNPRWNGQHRQGISNLRLRKHKHDRIPYWGLTDLLSLFISTPGTGSQRAIEVCLLSALTAMYFLSIFSTVHKPTMYSCLWY